MPNPAGVLGVDPDADSDTIEAAYRNRVLETHPDAGGSAEEFKRVKNAYEQLITGFDSSSTRAEQAPSGDVTVGIDCAECGSLIENRSDGWFNAASEEVYCVDCLVGVECTRCGVEIPAVQSQLDEDLYCEDCLVSTECEHCGKSLTLSKDDYNEVGGAPICVECGRTERRQSQSQEPFTHCSLCDSPIDRRMNATPGGSTGEYYCPGCITETSCVSCGHSLTMTIEQFAELNGNPICGECANANSRNNDVLSTVLGAAIIIGFSLGIGYWVVQLGILGFIADTIRSNRQMIQAVAGPGALILAVGMMRWIENTFGSDR